MNRLTAIFALLVTLVVSGCAMAPMANPEADAKAKTFIPPPDKASLYIYRNEILAALIPMTVKVNGKTIGETGPMTYFRLKVPPGKYRIESSAGNVSTLNLSARAGKNYYIWQEVKLGLLVPGSLLHLVDAQTGKAGVRECSLAALPPQLELGSTGSKEPEAPQPVASSNPENAAPATVEAPPVAAQEPHRPPSPALLELLAHGPTQTSYWGFEPANGKNGGLLIKSVRKGSPAARAGLLAGDLLLSVNGTPIRDPHDWIKKRNTFPLYTPLVLQLRRNGNPVEAHITVPGRRRLFVAHLADHFVIPGVPPAPTESPSAAEALDAFNVLERVIIDPNSGRIAVIGHYDPRYATGPIPYLDLLKTALADPVPRISIDPTPETSKLLQEMTPDIIATLRHFPFKKMVDFVEGRPDLERDRQIMIRELARSYGITPEGYAAWYNFAHLDVMSKDYKGVLPPPPLRDVLKRAYRHLGYPEVATALGLLYQQTPRAAARALRVLGHDSEAASILSRGGPDVYGSLMVAGFLAVAERTGAMPAKTGKALRKFYEDKRMTWQKVVKITQSVMPYMPKNGDLDVMHQAFQHFVPSSPVGTLMFPRLRQGRSRIRPTNLDLDSQLGRILFEADYSLKSLDQYSELFRPIAGYQTATEFELRNPGGSNNAKSSRIWMEPEHVDMSISPNHNVIDFKSSRIRVRTADLSELINVGASDKKPAPYLIWLTHHIMDHYDEYAHVLPALHKLSEAAKIVALAQWLRAEKLKVDLSGVVQKRWQPPKSFPMLGMISQYYRKLPNGGSDLTTDLTTDGGVTFRPKGDWATMTPSVQTETRAVDSLRLSAGLGQKAVQAAQAGDLEQARHLAELSAQAMNGSLSKADLAKMNVPVPNARPMALTPANVQLQKEMIKRTYQEIGALKRNPGSGSSASAALRQLSNIYNDIDTKPASASDFLHKLQTGQTVAAPLPTVPKPPAPVPHSVAPPSESACGLSLSSGETVPEDQKAYLNNKLAEERARLRHINEALEKLIALNESQRAQINELTAQITKDYKAAVNRAYDFAVTLLTDLPLAKYTDIQHARLAAMEKYIEEQKLLRSTPLSKSAMEAIERDIAQMTALKNQYQTASESLDRMLDIYSGAGYGSDIYQWDVDTRNSGDRKRGLDAALLAGKILLDHPWLKEMLKKQDWFGGNELWQVVAIGKMARTASGFFWDIMDEYAAWGPLAAQLQKGIKANSVAMVQLREKAQKTMQEIRCIKGLVQK